MRGKSEMIEAMKQALKYAKQGALVPVDVPTTKLLVDAFRAALAEEERCRMRSESEMTREEFNQMMQEAGFGANQRATLRLKLQRFAALAIAAEREACAKVCEDSATPRNDAYQASYVLRDCADDIRARGK